jgi:transcriptional regulator with XRE-family HTH domain
MATKPSPRAVPPPGAVGPAIREWRTARRFSQLALGLEAEISPRHLSFIESGRTQPSRATILRLAEVLDVPLRDRNALLLAAGFAPRFPERPLSDPELAQIQEGLGFVLEQFEPVPVVVVDRGWNVVRSNAGAARFAARLLNPIPEIFATRPNSLRLLLHPDGLRRAVVNWDEVATALLRQLRRAMHAAPDDPVVATLYQEIAAYPGLPRSFPRTDDAETEPVVVPLHVRTAGFEARLLSMMATLARAHDVTVQELRVETLVPADPASLAALRGLADGGARER